MRECVKKQNESAAIVCALLMGVSSVAAFCSTGILSKSNRGIWDFLCLFNEYTGNLQLFLIVSLIGMVYLYKVWLIHVKEKFIWALAVLALIFSVLTTISASLEGNTIVKLNLLLLFFHTLGYFIFYYVALVAGYSYSKLPVKKSNNMQKMDNIKIFSIVFVTLFLLWLPLIIMCFPGNMMWDTGHSINFILEGTYNNNPFFQNYLHGFVYKFGELLGDVDISIFLYNIFQVFMFLVVISYGIVFLKKISIPFWILLSLVCLYGCCPIFPLYAFCMGKDTNFALCLMVFSILMLELIFVGQNGSMIFQKGKMFLLIFVSILLGLLRNQAYLIAVFCLFSCSLVKTCKKNKKILWMACTLVIVVNIVVPRLFQIPKTDISENLSIPLQQTAYYVNRYGDEVTENEKSAISKVIPYETFKLYNPAIADPIKSEFDNSASAEAILGYANVWWVHFLKHPDAYFKALFYGSYAYYCPLEDRSDVKAHVHVGYAVDSALFEDTKLKPNMNPCLNLVRKIDNYLMNFPIIGLFQKIGVYTWIMWITIFYIFLHKKCKWLVCIFPSLFVFIGDCCSPVNGYMRYAFPMIISVPILCLGVVFILKSDSVKNNSK